GRRSRGGRGGRRGGGRRSLRRGGRVEGGRRRDADVRLVRVDDGLRAAAGLAGDRRLLHLLDELLRVEGLVHEVVRAGLLPLGRVVGVVAARQEHDGRRGVALTDVLREGVAV